MNKARRHELKMLKYKKRLKNYFLEHDPSNPRANAVFRSHGAPCSCWMCKGEKYRDTLRQKNKKIDAIRDDI